MKYVPEISSDYAVLDVKKGRKELAKALRDNPGIKFKLIIGAEICEQVSDDDGVSREFGMDIIAMHWVAEK